MWQVYAGPSTISGLGLFADQNFAKGDRIISLDTESTTKDKWFERCTSLSIPSDAAIAYNGRMLYDPIFISNETTSIWYYFNHSFNPNTKMKKRGTTIIWYATKNVSKHDELTFDYGDPDPSWS